MKALITTLIIILYSTFFSYSQEIKFMGINMDCKIEEFCKQLKEKGLKQTADRFEVKEFEGKFATYDNCRIIVKATEVSMMLKSIEVQFDGIRGNEFKVNSAYENLRTQYKNKYGKLFKEDSSMKLLKITSCNIKNSEAEIYLTKFLTNEPCLNVVYWVSKQKYVKETNPNKYSDDI